MTEPADPVFSQPLTIPTHPPSEGSARAEDGPAALRPTTVTLHLPADLTEMVQQHSQQVGQSPTEAILTLLRSALQLPLAGSGDSPAPSSPTYPTDPAAPAVSPAILRAIQSRLTQLEALLPRLEKLEGKSIAF